MSGGTERWKTSAARAELLALYGRVDALLAEYTCDSTAECCRFAITGREPYVTPVEVTEVTHAIAALGGGRALAKINKKRLPMADEVGACALLADDGRCRIYASRPFGCRTFFCDRAQGPARLPRDEIQRIGRSIADLSARFAPSDPRPRPFTRVLEGVLGS